MCVKKMLIRNITHTYGTYSKTPKKTATQVKIKNMKMYPTKMVWVREARHGFKEGRQF